MKKQLFQVIELRQKELSALADKIFNKPELGLKEYFASGLLCDFLEQNGFEVERGIAGLDTAFRARWERGTGGPSIGLLCEYDALEGLGHACAHHLQGPAILGAAMALKEVVTELPFKIVVYGTPAEETTGGKVAMLEKGFFQDIDVALMMHGGPSTTTDVRSLALSNFTVRFHGRGAHAALKPEVGRSALDSLILLFQGVEFLREHIPDDVRIHYVVSNGGGVPNVVPMLAEGKFSLRSYSRPVLDSVIERFKKIVQGASLMTETSFDIEENKALHSKVPVLKLNDVLMENARLLDAPQIRPPRQKTGSTDFGNVMYQLPGSCIRVAFVPEGTSSHSEEYVKAGMTPAAYSALAYGAKILAGSAYDLLLVPGLLAEVQEEFRENKRRETSL